MRPCLALCLALAALPARAAPRLFGWAYPTETDDDGTIEWESWLHLAGRDTAMTPGPGVTPALTFEMWNGATVGLTDRAELAVFGLAVGQSGPAATADALKPLRMGGAFKSQLRYRLLPRTDSGFAVTGIGEFEVLELFPDATNSVELRLAASWGRGPFEVTANLAHRVSAPGATGGGWALSHQSEYALGASWRFGEVFRLGLEVFGHHRWAPGGSLSAFVGPAIGVQKGRFWWVLSHGFARGIAPEAASVAATRSILGVEF